MQISKEKFKKILQGKTLSASDLTPEEKKNLYDRLSELGMSPSTAYLRFFDKGFKQWEILGVSQLRNDFLISSPCCVDRKNTEEQGSRGYGYVLTLDADYDDSKFYDIVSDLKMGARLCDFMAERGMTSPTTVRTRFKANDWKPWELLGISSIIDSLGHDSQ